MKRAAAALALVLVAALVGCLGARSRSQRGRLVIWTSHNNAELEVFRDLTREFAEEFRHQHGRELEVVLERVSHEGLDTRLKSAALSRTTPDLVRIDVAAVAALAWGSAAVRLDTEPGSPFRDLAAVRQRFVPAALESNLVPLPGPGGGLEVGLYGIPEQTNCLVLFRNRALFRENAEALRAAGLDPAQPPRTWDQFTRAAAALTDPQASPPRAGFGLDNTLWWSLPFLYAGGADLLALDPRTGYQVALGQDAGREALEWWVSLARTPRARPDGTEVVVEGGMWRAGANKDRAFMEGSLAMVLSGPWNVPAYTSRLPEVAVSLVPAGKAGTASTVGGNNLVLMPTCVDREAALALLDFVGSDAYQARWSRRLEQIPTTRKALRERRGEAGPFLRVFMEQMETARGRPPLPSYDPVEQIYQNHLETALSGERPAAEALETIVAGIEDEVLTPIREATGQAP